MVKAATNFSRSGVSDWIIQRVSAIILAVYVIVVIAFFVTCQDVTYQQWQLFILSLPMKILSVLALLSLLGHGWIGLWTVATDYIKPLCLRMAFHVFYSVALISMLIWGIDSLWF